MPKTNANTSSNVVPFEAPNSWSNPDTSLLQGTSSDRAKFPVAIFGSPLSQWVEAVAQSRNVPVDYVGASLLMSNGVQS